MKKYQTGGIGLAGLMALMALLVCGAAPSRAESGWQPSAGHQQLFLWPGKVPDAVRLSGPESADAEGAMVTDVSRPSMTVYAPVDHNTGVAILVFPGGGYRRLAMTLEGTDICDWLTRSGMTCILLKYRVPGSGPWWDEVHEKRIYPKVQTALQDAQRALGLIRQQADQWGLDPHKIGVMGFSAGGHLVAAVSTHFEHRTYAPVDAADAQSARPDFAVALYPGHLWVHEDEDPATRNVTDLRLRPDIRVRRNTPPTFLVQAEDDGVDSVQQSLTYYTALQKAGVPVEMHLYAQGGHAFGLRPTELPIGRWPEMVERWLHTIGVLKTATAP